VLPKLRGWRDGEGKKLAIFSSGSVKAQELFLGHTETLGEGKEGGEKGEDIKGLFVANFDTVNAGAKGEVESYVKIVKELGVQRAEEVLFLSDNVTEVRAALKAGLQSLVVDRPGNAPLTKEDRKELSIITSFDQLETE